MAAIRSPRLEIVRIYQCALSAGSSHVRSFASAARLRSIGTRHVSSAVAWSSAALQRRATSAALQLLARLQLLDTSAARHIYSLVGTRHVCSCLILEAYAGAAYAGGRKGQGRKEGVGLQGLVP